MNMYSIHTLIIVSAVCLAVHGITLFSSLANRWRQRKKKRQAQLAVVIRSCVTDPCDNNLGLSTLKSLIFIVFM